MGKCIVCGKSSLFLRVNSDSICKICADNIRREQEQKIQLARDKAQEYFEKISSLCNEIEYSVEMDDDPISRLDAIPLVDEKIEACITLGNLLDDYTSYEYLSEIVLENVKYKDSMSQRTHFGYIDAFSLCVYTGNTYDITKVIEDLKKQNGKYKCWWYNHRQRIISDANFQKNLISIPEFNITLDSSEPLQYNVHNIPEIKYSSVTSKSNYDKLGYFVAIDTETTGLSNSKDEIIEITAIKFERWLPVAKFSTLIKPSKKIPFKITSITGINDEMVADAPAFSQIITSLSEFIGNSNLVGHNLPFDLGFIYSGGFDFSQQKRKYYDTLDLARKTLRVARRKWDKEFGSYEIDYDKNFDVENLKLETLCDYFEIRNNASSHRADSDCLAAGILFNMLTRRRT